MAASVRGVAEHGGEERVESERRERLVHCNKYETCGPGRSHGVRPARRLRPARDGEGLGMARIYAQIRDLRSEAVQEI
jgi:hypothetical protein